MTGARAFKELLFVGQEFLLIQIQNCTELLLVGISFYLFKSMTGDRVFTELLFVGLELLLIQIQNCTELLFVGLEFILINIHDLSLSFHLVTFCFAGFFTSSNP